MTEYFLCDPTKNITALAMGDIPAAQQPELAAKIMKNEPTCEQVGFVTINNEGVELRMAGGEFCGNASMSAAALWCSVKSIGSAAVEAHVSGTDRALNIKAEKQADDSYLCTVPMPECRSVEAICLDGHAMTKVDMGGIVHLISEEKFQDEYAENAVKRWCTILGADALGLMQLQGDNLRPLVWVPGADTLFWESSCASGTTAVGAYLRKIEGREVRRSISQPGGTLTVEARSDGEILLSGKVTIGKQSCIKDYKD